MSTQYLYILYFGTTKSLYFTLYLIYIPDQWPVSLKMSEITVLEKKHILTHLPVPRTRARTHVRTHTNKPNKK